MIEQSDIVEIYSGDDFSSVTIKMPRIESESVCKKMNLTEFGNGYYKCVNNNLVALVMDRKTEFFSR